MFRRSAWGALAGFCAALLALIATAAAIGAGLKPNPAARILIRALIGRDKNGEPAALARRMGVQGLIFNCKSWWSGQEGLGKYSYCFRPNGEKRDGLDPTQAHMDHVHIELNWPGARKRTSFWRSPLAPRRGVRSTKRSPAVVEAANPVQGAAQNTVAHLR